MGGGTMGGGSSFLGTAAATVAGVVGGGLLLNGIRSMMGGHQSFGDAGASHASSPWDGGGDRSGSGDLARDAGLDDIGGRGRQAAAYEDSNRSGFLSDSGDSDLSDAPDDEFDDGDGGDSGDSDTA